MCKYGSCRVEWNYQERGMGTKQYCEEHRKLVRNTKQKAYDQYSKNRVGIKLRSRREFKKLNNMWSNVLSKQLNRTSTVVSHGK